MLCSEAWLRELVNPDCDVVEMGERLTRSGSELEGIASVAPEFSGVVVGRVIALAPHPDADRLRVCTVDLGGSEPVEIVCGAANVTVDMRVPVATVGARLPGDFKIKKSKLRGVVSHGMICSASELGLAEQSEGIMPLASDAPVGQDFRAYYGLDDQVLDIALTPNRGDCLSMLGIAQEVSALYDVPVQMPVLQPVVVSTAQRVGVQVAEPEASPCYAGRVITGIDPTVETPLWMQERLRRSGLKSISLMVDITNYVMWLFGQPLHAFDAEKLSGDIQVRYARAGETLVLLDDTTRDLLEDTLVIADDSGPIAIAGVMGGASTGVGDATTSIFLEAAHFAPIVVAGKARSYGLQTDAAHRFERGVDPQKVVEALDFACYLIMQLAGGEAGELVMVGDRTHWPTAPAINFPVAKFAKMMGYEMPVADMVAYLERLRMDVERIDDEVLRVTPPNDRFDCTIPEDIVEELARLSGFDAIPVVLPMARIGGQSEAETQVSDERVRAALVDAGYHEAINYTFMAEAAHQQFFGEAPFLALENPISQDLKVMRHSLLPGLLNVVLHNLKRQIPRVRVFEVGTVFQVDADGALQEREMVAGMLTGTVDVSTWRRDAAADFFDIKSDILRVLGLTGRAADVVFEPAKDIGYLHDFQAARVVVAGESVGVIGRLHPSLLKKSLGKAGVYAFECCYEKVRHKNIVKYQPWSHQPSVRRDLALVADENVPFGEIRDVVERAGGELLQSVELFDIYRGENLESGKKSFAISLILQDSSRTLKDKEVTEIVSGILEALCSSCGVVLRES